MYDQLDASTAASIWPRMDSRALAKVFARLERRNLQLRRLRGRRRESAGDGPLHRLAHLCATRGNGRSPPRNIIPGRSSSSASAEIGAFSRVAHSDPRSGSGSRLGRRSREPCTRLSIAVASSPFDPLVASGRSRRRRRADLYEAVDFNGRARASHRRTRRMSSGHARSRSRVHPAYHQASCLLRLASK